MRVRLSKREQETIILFNEEDKEATCYTCNKSLARKLDDLSAQSSAITRVREDKHGRTYTFPKKWLRVKMPRVLSEEQRLKLSEEAKRRFGKAKEGGEMHGKADDQR